MILLIPLTSNALIIFLIYFLGQIKSKAAKPFKLTFNRLLIFSCVFFLICGIIGNTDFINSEYRKIYPDYYLQMFIVWSIFISNCWALMIRLWIKLYL